MDKNKEIDKIKEFVQKFEGREVKGFIDSENKELFNLEDVSKILGFTETKKEKLYVKWTRVNKHIENNDVEVFDTSGEKYILEYGIYDLAFIAKNETARRFKKWITRELLPELRKTFKLEVMQMFSKEHQKEMMDKLKDYAEVDNKIYMVANTQVNRIVSELWGLDIVIKKADIETLSKDMLDERQSILEQWIDAYKIGLSKALANHTVRRRYGLKQVGQYKKFKC